MRLFLCLILLAALPSCTTFMAHQLVDSPTSKENGGPAHDLDDSALSRLGIDQQFRVPVVPHDAPADTAPDASLSIAVVEPKTTPKATVLILHGIFANKYWLLPHAHDLADAGYRAVLVDLRGHGASTGDYLTFGVREKYDIQQVITALKKKDLIAGKIAVLGISYGAAVAIQAASVDPRIAGVVAIAPFASVRMEAPHFIQIMFFPFGFFTDKKQLDEGLAAASKRAGINIEDASPLVAITKTTTPILLIHGTNDGIISHHQSELLHAADPDHSELVLLPGLGHVEAMFDRAGRVNRHAVAWLDQHIAQPSADSAKAP